MAQVLLTADLMSTSSKASIVALLLVLGGCRNEPGASATTDASVFCAQSVQAACADTDGQLGCLETWPEAQSDRSVCDRQAAFDEETFDCSQYFVLRTIRTDWGNDFLYDKGTGKLVAVLGWGIDPNVPEGCAGGPADLAPTGLGLLNCTELGDCWSQPDGGSAGDGP